MGTCEWSAAMHRKDILLFVCATLSCIYLVAAQGGTPDVKIPKTGFTCRGRASGYYADLETGCQVYHMCDGLGRKFSYSCPNTTLFQQRMLICDHWYMVNCSMSERDYNANLLIGQRDKPFVSDEEMSQRTPRPDILSVPPSNNYYEGLRESETKFSIHPDNNIVGIGDTIANDNDLDSAKQNYRPPTSWSTGVGNHRANRPTFGNRHVPNVEIDNLAGAASQDPGPTIRPVPVNTQTTDFRPTESKDFTAQNLTPSKELIPPFNPTTDSDSDDSSVDRTKPTEDSVFNFIKRFDPNSPGSYNTAISQTEIIDLNKQLPAGPANSEEDRTPRKNKNFGNNFNKVQSGNDKSVTEGTRFDSVNAKPETSTGVNGAKVPVPERVLLPPKTDYAQLPSTTMGPPIYYEWKWAVPAFGLEPPKESNSTNTSPLHRTRAVQGKSPFRDVTRPTPIDVEPTPDPKNTEYNISSYFVPDYVFPLDKPHPGYDGDDAETSFQVRVSRPGRASYGENPACPHCHPAYLNPGTCEPCIVKR